MKTFTLNELLSYWGIASNEVVGQFIPLPQNDAYGLLVNLMGFDEVKSGSILMHPLSDQRLVMQGYYSLHPFEQGQYYRFKVRLPETQLLLKNASDKISLKIDRNIPIEAIKNPYSGIVEKCFIRYNDPESNVVLASFIEEAGKGMYSSRRRVFFELLQNADDYPAGPAKSVRLKVEVLREHILLTYNSLPFSQADVRSIASIAQSTKLYDQQKTGYKGIGFKAVFTECKEVIIRSGGFQFAFNEKAEAFGSLESLYLTGDVVWNDSPKSQQRFADEYGSRATYYLDSKNIPWQLKPIWHERLPVELKQTESLNKNVDNVSIILKPGRTLTREFANDLQEIFSDSRFLLFLRHTQQLDLLHQGRLRLTIERTPIYEDHTNERHLATMYNNGLVSYQYMVEKTRISISEQLFESMGLDLRFGIQRKGDEEIRIFTNALGEKITGLPEKIASFDAITIHFAARMDDLQPIAEPAFVQNTSQSFIYTYLPMSEDRIRLPFLVSADFIPSSNREEIQSEVAWNHFLFYQIGYHSVKWVAYLAYTRQGHQFLDLLLPALLDSGISSIRPLEVWFNKGFQQALLETPFVPNRATGTESTVLTLDQVVVNKSPLLNLFDESFFYCFAGEEFAHRQLPAVGLTIQVLENQLYTEIYGVKIFTDKHLISQLSQPVSRKLLEEQIRLADSGTYQALLNYLNQLSQEQPEEMRGISNELTLIRFSTTLLSWYQLQTDTKRFVRSKRTQGIDDLLIRLGIEVSDVDLSQFNSLFTSLAIEHTYLSDNQKLFSFISAHTVANKLEPAEKKRLLDFFADENFKGVNKGSYAEKLLLFQSSNGSPLPLCKLLVNKIVGLPRWLSPYVISKQEQDVLGAFSTYLITEKTIFTRIFCEKEFVQSITATIKADEINDWADALIYYEEKAGVDVSNYPEGWFQMPWLYTSSANKGFVSAKDVHYSDALDIADASKVIESLIDRLLPHPKSRETIKRFKLEPHVQPINLTRSPLNTDINLSKEEAWLLLDFLIAAKEITFFKKWRFINSDTGFKLASAANIISYKADDSLHALIQSNYQDTKLTPIPDGLAEHPGLEKLGILSGRVLIEWLIVNKATLALTSFVIKSRDNDLIESLITKLPALPLDSTQVYDSTSPECLLIKGIRRIYNEKDQEDDKTSSNTFIARLRDKILLDGVKPESRFYQEKVNLKIGEKVKPAFNLSELIPAYVNSSSIIDKLEKGLIGLDKEDKRFLRADLFRSIPKKTADIVKELRTLDEPYLTPLRTVFLLMCEQAEPNQFKSPLQHFEGKVFYEYFYNLSEVETLNKLYTEFLTYCQIYNYPFDEIGFYHLNIDELVDAPEAINEEALPDWLTLWAEADKERPGFLHQWGINGPDSDVVKLRKAFLNVDLEVASELITELRYSSQLLLNTMQWLFKQQTPKRLEIWRTAIYAILSHIVSETNGQKYLVVMLPRWNKQVSYELIQYTGQPLHLYHEEWAEYTSDVFQFIKSQDGFLLEVDIPKVIQKKLTYVDDDDLTIELPEDFENQCELLNDELYMSWEKSSDWPIYVYEHNTLPQKVWYDGIPIVDANEISTSCFSEGKTFLTNAIISNFPLCLVGTGFPSDQLVQLLELQKQNQPEDVVTASKNKFYTPQFERIIGGDELNDKQQGEELKEAILRGIPFLEQCGFDFTESKPLRGLRFKNVERAGINELFKVTFRSAKAGLLYLNLGAWNRLGVENEVLVVVYQGGEMRLFESKDELMAEKWNEYMLYRVEKPTLVDQRYEGVDMDEKTTHLLFVTSEKVYQSLYQDKIARRQNKSVDASTVNKDEL